MRDQEMRKKTPDVQPNSTPINSATDRIETLASQLKIPCEKTQQRNVLLDALCDAGSIGAYWAHQPWMDLEEPAMTPWT